MSRPLAFHEPAVASLFCLAVENMRNRLAEGEQDLLRGAMARVQEVADACTEEYDRVFAEQGANR